MSNSAATPRRYFAYLLRLWRSSGSSGIWYASLEDPHTGERQGFAGLAELVAFLVTQLQESEGLKAETGALGADSTDDLDLSLDEGGHDLD